MLSGASSCRHEAGRSELFIEGIEYKEPPKSFTVRDFIKHPAVWILRSEEPDSREFKIHLTPLPFWKKIPLQAQAFNINSYWDPWMGSSYSISINDEITFVQNRVDRSLALPLSNWTIHRGDETDVLDTLGHVQCRIILSNNDGRTLKVQAGEIVLLDDRYFYLLGASWDKVNQGKQHADRGQDFHVDYVFISTHLRP